MIVWFLQYIHNLQMWLWAAGWRLMSYTKNNTMPKVKVKFTLEQAMKAQTGSTGIALLFL